MARRKTPEVNAGSMADIAFLLLIFFLVTTTMDVDSGIMRKLPPPPQGPIEDIKLNKRNVFVILINKDNQVAISGQLSDVGDIRERVVEFFTNPTNNPDLSEQIPVLDKKDNELSKDNPDLDKIQIYDNIIEQLGTFVNITKGVVSLQNDRGTAYGKYLEVQNEIVGAINDLRDDLAKQTWGKEFKDLNEEQQDIVTTIYPFAISEAEPRSLAN
ncbi:MAG: biopolymer transporter ExbD [Bacteroidales bacterium]|nr:biopolymer transporter ExbD [Bacteroidales bacterium]